MKFCEDILMSIDALSGFLSAVPDLAAYRSDRMLRRAVEREFEIIGEAMKQLLDEFPETKIPDSARIIGLRNRIIHGYADIDDGTIWSIGKTRLDDLRSIIQNLMEREEHA